jgi:hypothetical protein
MALTATASKGFELYRYTSAEEVLWVPGDPGDSYTKGDQVVATVGEGVVDPLAANEGGAVGRVGKTITCAANTTAFPIPREFDKADENAATADTLIPITTNVPAGIPVFRVTFENHWDDTVTSYTASTRVVVLGTGCAANDYANGALLYVHAGTGAGQVGVVEDYVHGTTHVVMHRVFETALDSTSEVIILGGEAATSRGIGFFNRCEAAGATSVTTNQGADDGDYVVYMDWTESAEFLSTLTLPVIPARYMFLA